MAQSSSAHDDVSASKEELEKYKRASNVNVSNFVVKLSGQSNYSIWKAHMLSLLDELMIRDIVENRDAWLKSKSEDIAKKYDILLQRWIFGSLDEELRRHFDYSDDVQSIWRTLENYQGHICASKEELEEYKKASYVNVSDFVLVKLSILSNDYSIWKAQMLSLLQDKLMIRDIFESRGDWLKSKSYDIAKKYDILLKGWILNSLDEELLRYFDETDDVQFIWRTLENYHCDVSATKEEFEKYMHASDVNASNIVSVKLSVLSNDYHKWKAEMLSLLDKLMIRDIVENRDAWLKSKSEDFAKKYDILLKGWILGSLDKELLIYFDNSDDVQSIWRKLENYYRAASKEELEKYMHASKVNVSNFVSVKLSILSNDYHKWKDEMLSLLDKLMIRDIVESRGDWLKSKSQDIAKKYDILLKVWILDSLDEELLRRHFDYSDDGQSLWSILANYHRDVSASKEELEEYMHASNVYVSDFVSVKLSGQSNYHVWKAQMLSLLDKLMIRDFVENTKNWMEAKSKDITKRYNILLKGWILGSLNEELLRHFDYSTNVQSIWATLADEYSYDGYPTEKVLIKVRAEDCNNGAPVGKLREATREGNWWRAQSILRKYRFDVTIKINDVDETMLHLAVGEGKNYFVQKLLNSIQDEELIEKKNNKGQTALHIAAIVGNKHAAELLVKKRENLLNVKDNLGKVPLLIAYTTNHISTFAYLFEATKTADELLSKKQDSFEEFIIRLIYRKEYDLAFKLYKLHLKSQETPTDKVLMAITRNFPSDLSFWEALIYPSWENATKKIVKRSSLLFYSFEYMYARAEHTLWRMKRFKNNYYSWLLPEIVMLLLVPIAVLYPVCQWILLFILVLLLPFYMLYSLLWKVLATVVAPIKDIEKRKKEYEEARDFLKKTVSHMDSCNLDNSSFYKSIALEAVRLDVYEVLRLIISHFNQTIEYTNQRHNIIQLAIIHRSEKVYNHIFYPLIKQKKSNRELKDYSGNNLLHLVGRLAPSNELSCTTGAALQLQRELQWREEVKKFMEPMQLTDKNIDDETPDMVFTREHADLLKNGENWMKKTADSCSITAALIVTIVFAAAITVPGGSNQETGIPLFKKQIAFTVFAISDAISLFSASTSLLVFLSILTTRFAEKDFLLSLPRRLLIALFLLFLSTSAMMLAFSAILFLVFCDQRPWMLAPIGVFTCMPIAAIVSLQLPLVVDLYRSTYSSMFATQKLHYSLL